MNLQNRFDAQAYNCNTLQAIDKLGDRIIDYMNTEKRRHCVTKIRLYAWRLHSQHKISISSILSVLCRYLLTPRVIRGRLHTVATAVVAVFN